MSKLLINERPLLVLPGLAKAIGLNEAIVLQQIHYWLEGNKERKSEYHFKKDRWWCYNSAEEWAEQFPWWSVSTIKRTLKNLRKEKLIYVDRLADDPYDRTNWYSIDYQRLTQLEQIDTADRVNVNQSNGSERYDDSSVQNDTMIYKETETTTETSGAEKAPPDGACDDSEPKAPPTDLNKLAYGHMPTVYEPPQPPTSAEVQDSVSSWCPEMMPDRNLEIARQRFENRRNGKPVYGKQMNSAVLNEKLPIAQRKPLADELLRIYGTVKLAEHNDSSLYRAHDDAVILHGMGCESVSILKQIEAAWKNHWQSKDGTNPTQFMRFASQWLQEAEEQPILQPFGASGVLPFEMEQYD